MLLFSLVAAAFAGTITLESEFPVGVRLDGDVVSAATTQITLTDVALGSHRVAVANLGGTVIAFYDVDIRAAEDVVDLVYRSRRLVRARDAGDPDLISDNGPKAMRDEDLYELQHKLLKGSPKKQFKRLGKAAIENWFTIRQVKTLIGAFESMNDRGDAAVLIAPKVLDPENVHMLDNVLPTQALKKRVFAVYEEQSR